MNLSQEAKISEPLLPFIDTVLHGQSDVVVSGLRGGATAFSIASIAAEADGPLLVILADSAATRAHLRDVAFFLGGPKSEQAARLRHYPALDISPFESISPHGTLLARRMSALSSMLDPSRRPIVVTPVEAVMERILSRETFSHRMLETFVDDLIDRDEFARELALAGYSSVPLTEDFGDFSVRGGIIDLFCPLYDRPIRIELDDIEVKSIRFFDPATQVSRTHVSRIQICPARQIVLSEQNKERFSHRIKQLSDQLGTPKAKRDALVKQIEQGIHFPGIEFFASLFFEQMGTVLDYLPKNARVLVVEPGQIEAARDAFFERVWTRRDRASQAGKLACAPEDLYLSPKEFNEGLSRTRQIRIGLDAFSDTPADSFAMDVRDHSGLREEILERIHEPEPLEPLARRIREVQSADGHCILVSSSPSGADRLERMLAAYEFRAHYDPNAIFPDALQTPPGTGRIPILLGDLAAGFSLPGKRLVVICEEGVFGEKKRTESVPRFRGEAISGFADLSENDYIVHVLHGVGIYRGLKQLDVAAIKGEYLLLEYARGDKLYLPVDRLSQVQRFAGSGGAPVVDRLGMQTWEKTKSRARVAARQIAKELLKIYAGRAAKEGVAFDPPDATFSEFESTFPYKETPDQVTAIADVLEDMTQARPMDRLVCGDVGFGKTEVALRAAFLAVLSDRQVAVLVPTTTLAFQHHRSFVERLAPFGANVAMLSRFTPPREVKTIYEGLKSRKIDVVIGTHRLLSKHVIFEDLGLLVIDEEQHFGVVQKENIRKLKEQVDTLAMTATPIPRTLNMALSGIRDLSIINTPPEDRLAVRTFITQWDEDTLREATERELVRGGQIFFVHNRIRTIDAIAEKVQRLAPKARVRVAHGQMSAQTIEDIIIAFTDHKFDILVSTAIIESGLDFPRANTIFIHRADILGLSQLYQLRGRVGRAKRRAYCYLIIPGDKGITKEARRRLAVLRTFTELGSGYKIAARDMEIRGAGNLLGEHQSGHISTVGLEMFTQLLEQEVRRLQGKQVQDRIEPELSLQVPAYLPEQYVPAVGQRLSFYKRLSDALDLDKSQELLDEMMDRYGPPPAEVLNLIKVMEIKIRARELGITAIESGSDTLAFKFDDRTPVRPSTLVDMVTKQGHRFLLLPDGRLIEKTAELTIDTLFESLKKTLQQLSQYDT